jgi:hypothetical protein
LDDRASRFDTRSNAGNPPFFIVSVQNVGIVQNDYCLYPRKFPHVKQRYPHYQQPLLVNIRGTAYLEDKSQGLGSFVAEEFRAEKRHQILLNASVMRAIIL